MEELLTPQICMDVDDTPLDVGKDSSDDETQSEHSQPDEDDKVNKLLEFEFKDPAQVPDELTDFERDAKKNVFSPGELAVQFHRLHCTACNAHLGSAPIGFFNRYIHPLLKVLICKSCYSFYCSGEFDKDEDGSEMYCRWCGQGGKVMCCAQCAYVFCQKCVRQNLGKKTLEIIKDSDDWMCFGCNPAQLINLKIVCSTLYDFTQEEIRLARALVNVERLKIDHSMCCTKLRPSAKRKREEDSTYNPYVEEQKPAKKGKMMVKTKLVEVPTKSKPWSAQKEDGEEVVCAPDVLSLMDEDNADGKVPPPAANKENKVAVPPLALRKSVFTATMAPRPLYICSSGNVPKTANITNIVRIQTPAIKLVSPTNATSTTVPLVASIPVQLVPGLKHEWFEKAATVVSTITGNLSFTLDTLTTELKDAKTVENLATVHNKLQELLSTSINSLIQVRKSLRNQFLTDLNNLKFTAEREAAAANALLPKATAEDDDVVIVKSDILPKKEPTRSNGRPYLKVRTVSQLLSVPAECITIPDDPPGDPLADAEPAKAPEETKPDDGEKPKGKEDRPEIATEPPPAEKTELAPPSEDKQPEEAKENEDPNVHDLSGYDSETFILIKNALTESKLDQIIEANMKCVTDFPEDELRRVLSVRVVAAVNSGPDLPANRLTMSGSWFTDDIEEQLECSILPNLLNEESAEKPTNNSPRTSPIESGAETGLSHDGAKGKTGEGDAERIDSSCEIVEGNDDDAGGDAEAHDDKPQENDGGDDNDRQENGSGDVDRQENGSGDIDVRNEDDTDDVDDREDNKNGDIDGTVESPSGNECDLSDRERIAEDDGEKSLDDDKEVNSENLVSDGAQTNDESRTEISSEPVTDSGIEVDTK